MTEIEDSETSLWQRFIGTSIMFIAAWIAIIWVVEILDTLLLGERLQGHGIQPRTSSGLDGILWSPFLHSNFGHLISNTAPFAVLGGLVSLRGRSHWLLVTGASILVGGTLTWVFARNGNHIGSSGVVFGYLGALLGGAIFERKMAYIAPALIAILFYGTIFVGIVPQDEISWEGHLSGLVAGGAVTYYLAKIRPTPASVTSAEPALDLNEFTI